MIAFAQRGAGRGRLPPVDDKHVHLRAVVVETYDGARMPLFPRVAHLATAGHKHVHAAGQLLNVGHRAVVQTHSEGNHHLIACRDMGQSLFGAAFNPHHRFDLCDGRVAIVVEDAVDGGMDGRVGLPQETSFFGTDDHFLAAAAQVGVGVVAVGVEHHHVAALRVGHISGGVHVADAQRGAAYGHLPVKAKTVDEGPVTLVEGKGHHAAGRHNHLAIHELSAVDRLSR